MEPLTIQVQNASKIKDWLKNRGGIAVWSSVNLSNPEGQWITPVLDETGHPVSKPTWQAGNTPRIITDPAQIIVESCAEVKRFHVAIRLSSNGLSMKCTDASSAKIEKWCGKYPGSHYEFDYATQEAVIFAPAEKTISLAEYAGD